MPNFKKNPNGFKMKYQGDKSAFPFKFQSTIGGRPLKSGPAPEKKAGKKLKETEVGKFVSGLTGSIFGGGKYKGKKSLGGQLKQAFTPGPGPGGKSKTKPVQEAPKQETKKEVFKPTVKKGAKGDPYTYRTTESGGYEFQKKGDKGWTAAKNKKAISAIGKLFGK